ncbi:ABC transporter permease [Candidatus Latescibacterota bacterium]
MSSPLRLVLAVFSKELRDGLRDRRSLLSTLAFPFLGPLLITFMFKALAEQEREAGDIDIPVVGGANAPGLVDWIQRRGFDVVAGPEDPQQAVRDGDFDFVVVVPEEFAEDFAQARTADVELVHDGSRKDTRSAVRRARRLVEGYGRMIGSLRLVARGVSPQVGNPLAIDDVDLASARKRAAHFFTFVPMFVIMAAFITGLNVAIDTTAGERERASLEPLLVNPVARLHLVLGKWLAAVVFSGIGVCLTLTSVVLALRRVPLQELGIHFEIGTPEIAGVLAATLPLALFASGLQILVATFSRSYKEAQTYASLLIMLPMVPHLIASVYSLGTSRWMLPIPALGQQVLLTDVFGGEAVTIASYLVVGVSSLTLGLLCVWVTAHLFQRERIIFGR